MDSPPSPPTASSVPLLVQRAQAGDAEAFDRLSRRYRAAILALTFLRTGHLDEAEDLAQDVLAKAWEKLATLHDPAAFVPWIKAIAANACRNWYRHAHTGFKAAPESDALLRAADHQPPPLEQVLRRERQRALHGALLRLPEANRAALMMHVWGGISYEEIAAFTGVKVTTVEGRIFRAKRQLRRLLLEEGKGIFEKPTAATPQKPRRLPVPQPEPSTPPPPGGGAIPHLPQPLALFMFSQRLSALIDSGVGLVQTFRILEEVPPPYDAAAIRIREKLEQGYTLSRTMREEPELFSEFYVALIRAGEIAGLLEETLQRATRMIALEFKLARNGQGVARPRFFSRPAAQPRTQDWADLTPHEREVIQILFCETFSILLMSGVPIPKALETVEMILPPGQRDGLAKVREEAENGKSLIPGLERTGIFSRFLLQMIAIGEEGGHLDRTLHLAAEALQQELEARTLIE